MPSIEHEAPLELLRGDPRLAAVLLEGLGIPVPPGVTARLASGDLTASMPTELRADAVVLLVSGGDAGETAQSPTLVVIIEVQLRHDPRKEFVWPAYLAQARAVHECDVVLLVICPDSATAARCRTPIRMGHPGFDLTPLVIDARTTPRPDPAGSGPARPELAVLGVLTGALDLGTDTARRLVLSALEDLDQARLETYTVFVRRAVSGAARQALEDLMTTTPYRDTFIERFKNEGMALGKAEGKAEGRAEGRAEGEARMVLRVLSARGLQVPDSIRERVLSCADISQLEVWGDRAATADTVDQVFGE